MREQGYTIAELCEAFGLSPSGYHASRSRPPSPRELENRRIAKRVGELHGGGFTGSYGSPRATRVLNSEGLRCSENRVARVMKNEGLKATTKRAFKPKTTVRDEGSPVAPNRLSSSPPPSVPGQQLAGDITYVSTGEGWLYLSVAIDLFSRKVLGWSIGESMPASLVSSSLSKASRYPFIPGGLFHSDRGCQYTSSEVGRQLDRLGLTPSMSAKGNCYDNSTCESFFATLKAEGFPPGGTFPTKAEARRTIFEYIETFYNTTRLHSSLGYLSPNRFLEAIKTQQKHLN